jgi:hypothetical protein
MDAEKTDAKTAEVKGCVHMERGQITARIVEGSQYVSTESARIFAKIAAEVAYVCIIGSSKRAIFAVRNVRMAKRAVDAKFALKHADKSLFSVRMGRTENNVCPAE